MWWTGNDTELTEKTTELVLAVERCAKNEKMTLESMLWMLFDR